MSPDRIRDSVLFLTDIICESDQQTCLSLYSSLSPLLYYSVVVGHNYRADILDCNFHINVLYGKPTISPPKMNSGFPMEKLSVVGGGVGQLHH